MTINEAEIKWNVKAKTIFSYIQDGKINNIYIENNMIILPDIPRPYIVKRNSKMTVRKLYEIIIKACYELKFIDVYLLKDFGVTESQFRACIQELEKISVLRKTDDFLNYSSNIGFVLTYSGTEKVETFTKKVMNMIEEVKPDNLNININIG